jgi:hypothetical protein
MAMLSANRRSPSLSPTSTRSLSEVARSESLDSEEHHEDDNSTVKKEDKSLGRSITDSEITKRQHEVPREEKILKESTKIQDNTGESDFSIPNKDFANNDADKDISEEVSHSECVDGNLDLLSHAIDTDVCNENDKVPYNPLNGIHLNNELEEQEDLDNSVNENVDKTIKLEEQVDIEVNETIDLEVTENNNRYDNLLKNNKSDEVLNLDYNKTENTKETNVTSCNIEKVCDVMDNYSNKSANSKSIKKSTFSFEIGKVNSEESIKNLDIQGHNEIETNVSTNFKANKNIIFDRDQTRRSFRKFDTKFEGLLL